MKSPSKREALMRTQKIFALILIAALCSISAAPQTPSPSLTDQLAAVTARGRLLAEYDAAAWHSTDAVLATRPPQNVVGGYVAQKTEKGWIVTYGKLSANRDRYLIAYEATQGAMPEQFDVKKLDPPREDTGYYLKAALALSTAGADFHGENRPYNASVLPADAGQFYVFIMPAQTVDGVYPFGGDVRYLVSADGLKIIEKVQFHKSILEFDFRNASIKMESGYHTDIFSDIPVDTDVFFVLSRKPLVPDVVIARGHVFTIQTDGSIVEGNPNNFQTTPKK
jgi:hypothetical protein